MYSDTRPALNDNTTMRSRSHYINDYLLPRLPSRLLPWRRKEHPPLARPLSTCVLAIQALHEPHRLGDTVNEHLHAFHDTAFHSRAFDRTAP